MIKWTHGEGLPLNLDNQVPQPPLWEGCAYVGPIFPLHHALRESGLNLRDQTQQESFCFSLTSLSSDWLTYPKLNQSLWLGMGHILPVAAVDEVISPEGRRRWWSSSGQLGCCDQKMEKDAD